MPTEDRFTVNSPETESVYPESPKSPSVPPESNPPGRASFQDHVDQLKDQNVVKPGETGNMPSSSMEPGRQDEGPTVDTEDQGPGGTATSGF
ncbi:MAG: hypothetical protein M3179_15165 [Actinomycetota bacterium]|nr:hypothetical protein [Actinomycetota bacterium]